MARRNTYIINKNYADDSNGTVEIPTIGAGTTVEMNAVTDMEIGDFWLNSDTNTVWKYDGSTWIDTGFSLGGSTVDLSNYQTPKLTDIDGLPLGVISSNTDLINAEPGFYKASGTYAESINGRSYENGVIQIFTATANAKTAVYIDFIGEIWTCWIAGTSIGSFWAQVGSVDLSDYYTKGDSDDRFLHKTGDNDIANDATYSNGTVSTIFGSGTYAIRHADSNTVNRFGVNETSSYLLSPDGGISIGVNNDTPYTAGNRLHSSATPTDDNKYLINSDVATFQKYQLTANDGTNLSEIISDSTLFGAPVGRYDKGSYVIGGDSSSGMIEVYDYGNTSGYKKANAYFSNEIWTCTFNSSGFSSGGWKKIAEEIVDAPGDLSTIDTLTTSSEFFDWIADSTFDSVFTPLYVYITGENSSLITGDSTSRMFLAEMMPGYTPSSRRLNIYGREIYTIDVDVYDLSIPTVFGLMYDMVYDSYSHSETVVSTDITAGVDIMNPVTILLSERRRSIKIELTGVLTSNTPNETITFELFVNDVSKGTITYDGGTNSTSNIYESNIHTVSSNDVIRVVATGSTTVAGFVKIKQV